MRVWCSKGLAACLLLPAALLFGGLTALRRSLYNWGVLTSTKLPVPVVVVGNVVAGGAGKTPLVIALARHLMQSGLYVGVVSRGYGRQGLACQEVGAETPVTESGDEPALVRQAVQCPVFVAPRRADAARALLLAYPATQLIICDDGLQHYALARDIEIAVFDDRGIGNGWLMPAGPLREPWPARQALGIDLVLHSGQKPAFSGFRSTRRLAEHAVAADGKQVLLSTLTDTPLVALAAIAQPDAFFDMLQARGLTLKTRLSLPDHDDLLGLNLNLPIGAIVLCTEKDAVKLFKRTPPLPVHLLAVPLAFEPEEAFYHAFDALLAPLLA